MILALIVIETTYFSSLTEELASFYGEDKTPYLHKLLNELGKKVWLDYSQKSKTEFEKNLQAFAEKALSIKQMTK